MHEIPLADNEREYPNEYTEVERPLLVQLEAMGWQCVRGDLDYPQKTFRDRFRDVILMDKLRDAVRRINRDDAGNPYLDDVTIDRAIRELLTTTAFGVFDKNRELTDKLIGGVSVELADGESGQRSLPVKFIEFDLEHLDRNEFLAINQFRVDFIGRTGFVIPDIVLFVSGIPLAVIECKSPSITEPMQAGIDQLLRYSNNRPEVEEIEGVDQLFRFNQLMVSTWFYEARVATLAFLCVQNMLLTGFNAPIEQVMYLDRRIYDHDLLQAIARVNRKRKGKKCGYVVDYVGIARAIRRALEGIDEETSDGGQVAEVLDEIPRLEDRHARVMQVFTGRGIRDIRNVETCVDLLADEQIRAEFINYLSDFLASLGIVMPRPDALPYLRDAKILGFISRVAANLYRDDQLNLLGVEPKVRHLIDQYIAAQGIDRKFEKVDITDLKFSERVARGRSSRARASEMVHALRHHIRIHTQEDPEFFRTMSEKLVDILKQLQGRWEELERVLAEFIRNEVTRGRLQEIEGLDPKVHAPFFGILKTRIDQQRGEPLEADAPEFAGLVQLTTGLVSYIQSQIRTVDFWRDDVSQLNLETWVYNTIRRHRVDGQRLFAPEGLRELAIKWSIWLGIVADGWFNERNAADRRFDRRRAA